MILSSTSFRYFGYSVAWYSPIKLSIKIVSSNAMKICAFFGGTLTPLVIDSRIESIDIDTEEDFNYAKYCWNFLSK